MCIMEVRAGQHTSTIAQACAHNLSTIERDLDMYEPLIIARGQDDVLSLVQSAHEDMRAAYGKLLLVFTDEIAAAVLAGDHEHEHGNGNERVTVERVARDVAERQANAARRFETR